MRPALGRLIGPDDDREGASSDVVVLAHRYWTTRFGANPAVLNDTLTLNGVPMTIVGVAPPGFSSTTLLENERFYVPLRLASRVSRWRDLTSRRNWFIYAMARLKPGVSMAQAEAQLAPPFASIVRDVEFPAQRETLSPNAQKAFLARRLRLESGSRGQNSQSSLDEARTIVALLFAVTILVLLIACANVANLLLVRATERTGEMAVRLAIGASSVRVVRLMLVESGVLALLGGAGSLLVARLAMAGLLALLPVNDAELLAFDIDRDVLLFTGAVTMLTALLFGMAPAMHAVRAVRTGSPGMQARATSSRGMTRLRSALAGSQVALATALLALPACSSPACPTLRQVDLGVTRAGLAMFRVAPVLNGYRPPQSLALFDRIERGLRDTPGVLSVSGATVRILDDSSSGSDMAVGGYTPSPDSDVHAQYTDVGSRYFSTLGIPLIAGREFTDADSGEAAPVAIVNEAFVRKFKLGAGAIGTRIGTNPGKGEPPNMEIVGVVADSAYSTARQSPPPQFFRPYRQQPVGTLTFYVRTAPGENPSAVLSSIPPLVRRLDANLPVEALLTMDQQFDENTTSERILMTMSSSLAALATLLAAIGLYAVLAYSVSQRVREIGIRVALGAHSAAVQRLILGQTLRIAGVASVVGLAVAVGLGQLGRSMLFGVDAFDPRAQVGAAALMLVLAVVAGSVPARRAAAVDPVEALRAE
jgi:predicted permease